MLISHKLYSLTEVLDTIKVGIPLTRTQHLRIFEVAQASDRWLWIQMNPVLGELRFVKMSGLVKTDQHSYHRELKWDVDPIYSKDAKLILEFSIPKYWYGHNIRLLYDFVKALSHIKVALEQLFKLQGRSRLPDPLTWHLYRVDVCYAWLLPNQMAAQEYLDSLKHLHYPRKRPVIYPTSVVFQGATYTLKFYLKYPEFRTHDLKELVKAKAAMEWINYLEGLAEGVLRCEATLRRQYLKVKGLLTVDDLITPLRKIHWDDELSKSEGFHADKAAYLILGYWASTNGVDLRYNTEHGVKTPVVDGQYFFAPPSWVLINDTIYEHHGGGFTYREENKLMGLLQQFMGKFLGTESKMQEANQVEAKLLEIYKPVKAATLVGIWLYIQRFGSKKAKETFGENSFYRSKRELKKAGVSLIDADKVITTIDDKFLRDFQLTVPSSHVVNREDDFRDSGNILNFVPKTSGNF